MQTEDNKILSSDFFFQGICEARNDPLNLGRIKVRIFGLHTDDLRILSADDLPWASILIPTTESGPAGIGTSVGGISTGTWVFGIFLDGVARQQPLVLGSIQGQMNKPEESVDRFGSKQDEKKYKEETEMGVDLTKGFFDPHEDAMPGNPNPEYANKSELNKLSRGETKKTFEDFKNADLRMATNVAFDRIDESPNYWNENKSKRKSIYPYNKVSSSAGGTITETDDTPSKERIQTIFEAGQSYVEWGLDGYEYKKLMGEVFTVKFAPQEKLFIHGRFDSNIDGEVTNLFTKSHTSEVYDTYTLTTYDSFKVSTYGQINMFAGGDYVLMVNNGIKISANDKMELDVGSTYKQSFHDVHHSVFWQRQYSWNEGQYHSIRKRNVFEKNNEKVHSIVIENRRDMVADGDQDTTIAKHYKLWVGADGGKGDYSITSDGKMYEKIKKEVHILHDDNEIESVTKSRDTSIGESWKKVILQNDEEKIGADAKMLVKGNRSLDIEGNQETQIGGNRKKKIIGNDEEQVQRNKNLNVAEWFFSKLTNAFTKIGVSWLKTETYNILGELVQEYTKRKNQLFDSLAIHILNSLSLKIAERYNIEVGANFAINVKGALLIKADQGIIISSGTSITMGSTQGTIIGSSQSVKIIAPDAYVTPDDVVPNTVKASYPAPSVTSSVIDLSSLKSLKPPTIPELNLEVQNEVDVKQPEEPTKPEAPEAPKKGEFLNGRKSWQSDIKLSKNNENSSLS